MAGLRPVWKPDTEYAFQAGRCLGAGVPLKNVRRLCAEVGIALRVSERKTRSYVSGNAQPPNCASIAELEIKLLPNETPGQAEIALPKAGALGRAAVKGMSWLAVQMVAGKVLSFASQLVLARLLVPEAFGVFALVGTVSFVILPLASLGVDDVLLQRQHTIDKWLAPAFWTCLVFGLIGMAAIIAISPFAAAVYHTPELRLLLPIMALTLPLGAISTIPTVLARAKLNFRLISRLAVLEAMVTQAFMIVLALNHMGVYSFVLPLPIVAAAKAAVYWLIMKPRIGRFRLRHARMMVSKGTSIVGTRAITAAVKQGDYFVLGMVASKLVLGNYYFGYQFAIQPVQLLAGSLANVLFPALSQLRNDLGRQHAAAIKAARTLALIAMPCCFLQAAAAPPLLHILFGEKWGGATAIVQILSIGLAFDAVSWVAGALVSARGEFRWAFKVSFIAAIIFFADIAIAGWQTRSGIGVAAAVSIFYIVIGPIYTYLVLRKVGVKVLDIAKMYGIPATLAGIAMGVAYLVGGAIPWGNVARLMITIAVGSTLYVGLLRLLFPLQFAELIVEVKKWRKK